MDQIGKTLVAVGLGIAALGGLLWLGRGMPWLRLGRLPGDFVYEKNGVSVFVPITTMILLSLAASLVMWVLAAIRR